MALKVSVGEKSEKEQDHRMEKRRRVAALDEQCPRVAVLLFAETGNETG